MSRHRPGRLKLLWVSGSPTWQSKRFCFSEFVAAGDPENLNGFPAPVGPDGEWRRNWIRQCAEVVAAVDPVVQVFGSQQDVGRCHPFSAATYHPPALRCRIRGAGLICGRGIKKERAILNIGPGGATGDVKHRVVEPTRQPFRFSGKLEKVEIKLGPNDVFYWHLADMPTVIGGVRYWGVKRTFG
jgi:hypothetical protein